MRMKSIEIENLHSKVAIYWSSSFGSVTYSDLVIYSALFRCVVVLYIRWHVIHHETAINWQHQCHFWLEQCSASIHAFKHQPNQIHVSACSDQIKGNRLRPPTPSSCPNHIDKIANHLTSATAIIVPTMDNVCAPHHPPTPIRAAIIYYLHFSFFSPFTCEGTYLSTQSSVLNQLRFEHLKTKSKLFQTKEMSVSCVVRYQPKDSFRCLDQRRHLRCTLRQALLSVRV